MLVRLLSEFRRGTRSWSPGDLADLPARVAATLIEQGQAVPARTQARETTGATVTPLEGDN